MATISPSATMTPTVAISAAALINGRQRGDAACLKSRLLLLGHQFGSWIFSNMHSPSHLGLGPATGDIGERSAPDPTDTVPVRHCGQLPTSPSVRRSVWIDRPRRLMPCSPISSTRPRCWVTRRPVSSLARTGTRYSYDSSPSIRTTAEAWQRPARWAQARPRPPARTVTVGAMRSRHPWPGVDRAVMVSWPNTPSNSRSRCTNNMDAHRRLPADPGGLRWRDPTTARPSMTGLPATGRGGVLEMLRACGSGRAWYWWSASRGSPRGAPG